MIIQLVTYNMGMGASRADREAFFATKEQAFRIFADSFSNLYNADRSSTWLLCLQEIDRDYKNTNQVEELQKELERQTGVDWYKHSNTRDESGDEEAVAIFSTAALVKEQKWDLGDDRRAQAVKAEVAPGRYVWAVTAHLLRSSLDEDGSIRTDETETILRNMIGFDANVPILFGADMNVEDPLNGSSSLYDQTVGKMKRFGFTRGDGYVPAAADYTVKAWTESGDILDYLLVNPSGRCTTARPVTLNFRGADGKYASDHKGVQMTVTVA
jgi:endonuclease/exonuclease/phosphatase family metal-dependent hydrolase